MKEPINKTKMIKTVFVMMARQSKAVTVEESFLSHRRKNMEDMKQRYAYAGNLLRAEISFSEYILDVLD